MDAIDISCQFQRGQAICRLHKLKQKHQQMQSVVQRAAMAPTEQVSWDDEEGDTKEEGEKEVTSEGWLVVLPTLYLCTSKHASSLFV